MRNSQVLIERKAMEMFSKKERGSNKISRTKRVTMKSIRSAWSTVH